MWMDTSGHVSDTWVIKALKTYLLNHFVTMGNKVLGKHTDFWQHLNSILTEFLFFSVLFLQVWSGWGSVGRSWCHIILFTSQDLATFQLKSGDYGWVVSSLAKFPWKFQWTNLAFTFVTVSSSLVLIFLSAAVSSLFSWGFSGCLNCMLHRHRETFAMFVSTALCPILVSQILSISAKRKTYSDILTFFHIAGLSTFFLHKLTMHLKRGIWDTNCLLQSHHNTQSWWRTLTKFFKVKLYMINTLKRFFFKHHIAYLVTDVWSQVFRGFKFNQLVFVDL